MPRSILSPRAPSARVDVPAVSRISRFLAHVEGGALCLLSASLLFAATSASALPMFYGEATDPTGDAIPQPGEVARDLISASATVDSSGSVGLSVRFADGSFDANTTLALFLFDTDQDPTTGFAGSLLGNDLDVGLFGVDFLLIAGAGETYTRLGEWNGSKFGGAVQVGSVSILPNGMDIGISLADLGDDDGLMSFKVHSSTQLLPSSALGVPNTGPADTLSDLGLAPVATTVPTATTPEPDTGLLVLGGVLGLAAWRRRRAL